MRWRIVGGDGIGDTAGHLTTALRDVGCGIDLAVEFFLSVRHFFSGKFFAVIVGAIDHITPRAIALAFTLALALIAGLVLFTLALITLVRVFVCFFLQDVVDRFSGHPKVFGIKQAIFRHPVFFPAELAVGHDERPSGVAEVLDGPVVSQTHMNDQGVDHVVGGVVPEARVTLAPAEVVLKNYVEYLVQDDKRVLRLVAFKHKVRRPEQVFTIGGHRHIRVIDHLEVETQHQGGVESLIAHDELLGVRDGLRSAFDLVGGEGYVVHDKNLSG